MPHPASEWRWASGRGLRWPGLHWPQLLAGCWVAALGALLAPAAAQADGMSCGGRIVSLGDSRYQVRSLCGEPDDEQRRIETRTVRRRVRVACGREQDPSGQCDRTVERSGDVVVDEWTYDFGRQRFVRYLTFLDGRLVSVQTGGYGSRDDR